MKLFIIGSTGPTGLQLVDQALAKGHEVVTVVRSPDKVTAKSDKLKVVEGSILNAATLTEHMKGCDAVVSAIGGKNGTFTPCTIYTSSGVAIVQAMRDSGVKRLVVCTAWATKDHRELPLIWRWVFRHAFICNVLRDMGEFEDYLKLQCSDLNITVVRPGMLSNNPSSGKKARTAVGKYCVGGYWWIGDSISRADVASFMLSCLDSDEYDRAEVAII